MESREDKPMREVQVAVTLRSGRQVNMPLLPPQRCERKEETPRRYRKETTEKRTTLSPQKAINNLRSSSSENGTSLTSPHLHFQVLSIEKKNKKKKETNTTEILEVLKQVKVNIILLEMIIKQVLSYAKFLQELGRVKKNLKLEKKSFLAKEVSAIIGNKTNQIQKPWMLYYSHNHKRNHHR